MYNAGIALFGLGLRLAAPFHAKARRMVEGQRHWADALGRTLAGSRAPIAWFHAASLGEFEQGRPVIEAFRAQYPDYRILLTFFSPSGYEVRKNYAGVDYVLYLPTDTPANARQFVQLVQPRIAFFIKYEFWYNYLRELRVAHVPILCFSAAFRPDQLFFKPYGGFYRNLLRFFDHILVQNEASVALLAQINVSNVTLAGDTRFDRVSQTADHAPAIPVAEAFKAGRPLLVVGSAWPGDMAVLIPFLNGLTQPLKVIIAPHEINVEEIERWRGQLVRPSVRYSHTDGTTVTTADVLFIDNVGMLSALYQYGQFAYVGGAFGEGLHNILEPAAFGMPVFFGPQYADFPEATALLEAGGAFSIRNAHELTALFTRQYADPSAAGQASRDYVRRNIGATAQVINVVNQLMSE